MDLYEALKSGTSEDDLITTFWKDLTEAQERIATEEQPKQLDKIRKNLATAIHDYCVALCGDEVSQDIHELEEYLKQLEKELEPILSLTKKKTNTDEDIIKAFLDKLI
jgi:flagellar motility protein MotE (MotC chaperone)